MVSKKGSVSKYYTLEDTLCAQGALFGIHRLGEVIVPAAIGEVEIESWDNDAPAEDAEAAAFRMACTRKAQQAKDAALDPLHNVQVMRGVVFLLNALGHIIYLIAYAHSAGPC